MLLEPLSKVTIPPVRGPVPGDVTLTCAVKRTAPPKVDGFGFELKVIVVSYWTNSTSALNEVPPV
jgi:hypothetical protein